MFGHKQLPRCGCGADAVRARCTNPLHGPALQHKDTRTRTRTPHSVDGVAVQPAAALEIQSVCLYDIASGTCRSTGLIYPVTLGPSTGLAVTVGFVAGAASGFLAGVPAARSRPQGDVRWGAAAARRGTPPGPKSGLCLVVGLQDRGGGGGWHKASVLRCLPLAACIGLSPLLILNLCGSERVLVPPNREGGGGS